MVYKKIGDKIPSLSSLLLAGALFTAGKCKSGDSEPEVHNGQDMLDGDASKPVDTKGEAGKVAYNPYLNEAFSKAFGTIVEDMNLGYLGSGKLPPLVLKDNELQGGGKAVIAKLEKMAESFNSHDSYKKLKPLLVDFKGLHYRTGMLSTAPIKSKAAHGKAMNAIAEVKRELFNIVSQIIEKINTKASPFDFIPLKEMANKLLDSLQLKHTKLNKTQVFLDVDKPAMLTGPQLARHLSAKDEKGAAKPDDFGMITLLGRSFQDVWIVGKQKGDGLPKASAAASDVSGVLSVLSERGAEMLDSFQVNESSTKMPKIEVFPNDDKALYEFKISGVSEATTQPAVIAFLSNEGKLFDALPESAKSSSKHLAVIQEPIKFGTLLFTLFKGEEALDLLQVRKVDKSDKIELVGHVKNFDTIKNLISQEDRDMINFAKSIGNHVQKYMPDLFVIPDIKKVTDSVAGNILAMGQNTPLNAKYTPAGTDPVEVENLDMDKESALYKVYKNICESFKIYIADTHTAQDLLNLVRAIGGLLNQRKLQNSTASMEQKVIIGIAQYLTSAQFLNTVNGSLVSHVISAINNTSAKLVDGAIVKFDGTTYQATHTTALLKVALSDFVQTLSKKHGQSSVTFETIRTELEAVNKDTLFDIEKVRSAIYEEVESIVHLPIEELVTALDQEGKDITLSTFPDLVLTQDAVDGLNSIRKEYQEKKKKTNAPVA